MATFNLKKGQSFNIEKQVETVHCGLFWEPAAAGPSIDLDLHCFGLVHPKGDANRARLHEEGSHALCYAFIKGPGNAEGALKKNIDGSFETQDGSMWHERDDRTGRGGGGTGEDHGVSHAGDESFAEESMITLANLPDAISEIAVWATIYQAEKRGQDFSKVRNAGVEVCDSQDVELCRYTLGSEFAGKTAIQVASFLKQSDGSWKFQAVGAASTAGLGDIITAYLG
jgi:tellurium resistance protein TerD